MDTQFKIRKADKKTDLVSFIHGLNMKFDLDKNQNIININNAPVYITFGKTYIRIQDTENEPSKITQLFYDTLLYTDKYAKKIEEIIESSATKMVSNKNLLVTKEKYISLLRSFVTNNKYSYEPYSIDKFEVVGDLFVFSSENNFTMEMFINKENKLVFCPEIDKKIVSDLSPHHIKDMKEYINIMDSTLKKIEKLKKVITIIIHDINLAMDVNIGS